MALTLRTKTGSSNAIAAWVLEDNTVVSVPVTQENYDEFVKTGGSDFSLLGQPSDKAVMLWAVGGCPAYDTADGYLQLGDCAQDIHPTAGKMLLVRTKQTDITQLDYLLKMTELDPVKDVAGKLPIGTDDFSQASLDIIELSPTLSGKL